MRICLLMMTVFLCWSCAAKRVQTASPGLKLKILSYNIHHANPPSKPGVIDIAAIADVIIRQQPDLVALQEVDVNTRRSGATINEAAELAKLTKLPHYYFAKAIDHDGGAYGVAILSRYPLSDMKSRPLPDSTGSKAEKRTLGSAIVSLPGGTKILFASTHLDAGRGDGRRIMQMEEVVRLLGGEKMPVVVAGDFNAQDTSQVVKIFDEKFTRTCVSNCGFTIPEIKPNKTIDYIGFRASGRISVVSHQVINEPYASDHLPVLAELLLKPSENFNTQAQSQINPASNAAGFTTDSRYKLQGEAAKERTTGKMLGADISFLPQLEARGIKFSDKGVEKDAIAILKDHGFNYIRLRIFNEPARDSGYSPGKGFCDLTHTLAMAKRVKAAGMKLLLDFHYSDTWADPGKQFKPFAWKGLEFSDMTKALYDFTKEVMVALKAQGTTPDMVQVGNEINHGMVWPDGNVKNFDNLAQLVSAGTAAVKSVDPSVIMMLHIALGGQNAESVFFIENMKKRNVHFDVIGQSYYPKWHGTLDELRDNLDDLAGRYKKDIIIVEYSQFKNEVNKIGFEVKDGRGKGTCIWEPLSTWEQVFDRGGKSNELILVYDEISKKFMQ